MTKLSIVIPVYNVENYLRKCVDSVIYPELSDYEIIIVNDGSTDSSPQIAEEYVVKYPHLIRMITTPNGGLGHARDVGINAAEGEYLLFLDSDDYLCENAVPEIMELIQQDFDICVFDFISVTESGNELSRSQGSNKTEAFTLEENPEFLFCPPNAWCKIWKRKLFIDNSIEYPSRVWFEDLCTSPKLYLFAEKIIYKPKAWYMYLQRAGSITNSKNTIRHLEIINAVDTVIDFYKNTQMFEKYRDQLEYMALYHQVIVSTTRINLADSKSPHQRELYSNFKAKFPHYKNNAYVKSMPSKYKLLLFLIENRMYGLYHFVMKSNNLLKQKNI